MREFPPDSLIARLIELRLCTMADMARAARSVRRMTRDLPAFDSVWVDALVQRNVLTPFQARWLESRPPETLIAGDYVLTDGLGADTASQTFLARAPRGRRVALKRLCLTEDQAPAVELRLQLLVERARNCATPHLAAAIGFLPARDGVFVASPYVAGLNLQQLLIRRGRFPSSVVGTILDQTLAALAAWHATGAVHGDVRLPKLRLTNRGRVVLVDAGIRPATTQELLVHQVQTPDEADVIAPERIGTNQPATAATDLYSVGCVCWQMLTGRAPHLTADPLAKLAAHQTRRIPDVRELAPETPAELADMISRLTSPDPQQRPASAAAVRRHLGLRGHPRRDGLIRFRRQFDSAVPHLASHKSSVIRPWPGLMAAMLMLGLCLTALSDRGLRSELLHIAERSWREDAPQNVDSPSASGMPEEKVSESQPLAIPEPNAQGIITLTGSGPYFPRIVSHGGPLVVEAAGGVRPKIVISGEAWEIAADRVVLKDLDVEWTGSGRISASQALIRLRTRQVQATGCRLIGPLSDGAIPEEFSAIVWDPDDPRDPQTGIIEVERVSLRGAMNALTCGFAPRDVTCRHVLKTDRGSLLNVEQAPATQGLKLNLEHVTLRNSGPLVACGGPLTEHRSASLIEIEATNSVFALNTSSSLVELRGPTVRPDWAEAVRVMGDGCLLPPEAVLLTHRDADAKLTSILESDEQQFDGVIGDAFEFAGELSADPRDSVLTKTRAPRRPGTPLPGIDAALLPEGPSSQIHQAQRMNFEAAPTSRLSHGSRSRVTR